MSWFLKVGASFLKFNGTKFHRELVGSVWPQSLSLIPGCVVACLKTGEPDTRTPSAEGACWGEPTSLEQSQD